MIPGDRAVIDRWWQHLLATGSLPADLELVQGRLVRSVWRGQLPSGPVHVKAMTFPRRKDKLRYALRALPGEHEAAMLRAVAAADIPCPAVVDVRGARRAGLPHRSLLVLRTLPRASVDPRTPAERLLAEATVARRLLAAEIVHRDLHTGNFLPLADGSLAVLDLQSASHAPRQAATAAARLAAAAHLLRDRPGLADDSALECVQAAGLLLGADEVRRVQQVIVAERRHYRRSRVLRCLQESTEFVRQWRWSGVEHRLRAGLGDGSWQCGGRELRAAWLGQRVEQLDAGKPLRFSGFFTKWWWLGGGCALYVPPQCSGERFHAELRDAKAAWQRFADSN